MTEEKHWELDMNAGPIFVQIGDNVRQMLARGDLKQGDKLPSARELAAMLGVNPNTVVHAYGELERMEVIETKRGRGTFVRTDAPVTQMRRELLRNAVCGFAEEVRRLGVDPREALGVLEEVWDVGQPD